MDALKYYAFDKKTKKTIEFSTVEDYMKYCFVNRLSIDSALGIIKKTFLKKYGVEISTVFLPLDCNYLNILQGISLPPILFETMVFWKNNPKLDQYQRRYCTYKEALNGHYEIVKRCIRHIRKMGKVEAEK